MHLSLDQALFSPEALSRVCPLVMAKEYAWAVYFLMHFKYQPHIKVEGLRVSHAAVSIDISSPTEITPHWLEQILSQKKLDGHLCLKEMSLVSWKAWAKENRLSFLEPYLGEESFVENMCPSEQVEQMFFQSKERVTRKKHAPKKQFFSKNSLIDCLEVSIDGSLFFIPLSHSFALALARSFEFAGEAGREISFHLGQVKRGVQLVAKPEVVFEEKRRPRNIPSSRSGNFKRYHLLSTTQYSAKQEEKAPLFTDGISISEADACASDLSASLFFQPFYGEISASGCTAAPVASVPMFSSQTSVPTVYSAQERKRDLERKGLLAQITSDGLNALLMKATQHVDFSLNRNLSSPLGVARLLEEFLFSVCSRDVFAQRECQIIESTPQVGCVPFLESPQSCQKELTNYSVDLLGLGVLDLATWLPFDNDMTFKPSRQDQIAKVLASCILPVAQQAGKMHELNQIYLGSSTAICLSDEAFHYSGLVLQASFKEQAAMLAAAIERDLENRHAGHQKHWVFDLNFYSKIENQVISFFQAYLCFQEKSEVVKIALMFGNSGIGSRSP